MKTFLVAISLASINFATDITLKNHYEANMLAEVETEAGCPCHDHYDDCSCHYHSCGSYHNNYCYHNHCDCCCCCDEETDEEDCYDEECPRIPDPWKIADDITGMTLLEIFNLFETDGNGCLSVCEFSVIY